MKKIKKISVIAIILFVASCCKKDDLSVVYKNRLKRIYINHNNGIDSIIRFDFLYDTSTLKLIQVNKNNEPYWRIDFINPELIKVTYYTPSGNGYIYAHIISNNRIVVINQDITDLSATSTYRAKYKSVSMLLDTIWLSDFLPIFSGGYAFSDINSFNFIYRDGNCIQSTLAYVNSFNGNPINDTNLINITYCDIRNEANYIPMQNVFVDYYAGANDFIDLNFILGINGYYFSKPNEKLIQTSEFALGNKINHYFEYDLNDKEQIVEMRYRETSTTNLSFYTFKFEYY